jgi:hypothetical protein
MYRYVLNVSMGNSDLNSSSMHLMYLRVERFVTFLQTNGNYGIVFIV